MASRTDRTSFFGLPATALGAAFLCFVWLYAEIAFEVGRGGEIIATDALVSDLLFNFRSDGLVANLTLITALAHWRAILVLALTATALMWVYGRNSYIPALWLVLAGNQISVTLLKLAFARTRPTTAVYVELSGSFPSGHSASIAAVSIFLAYVLIRERVGRPTLWVVLAIVLIFLVGLSRIYLNEHFVSDVLNGYAVGALWSFLGIFAAEHWATQAPAGTRRPVRRGARRETVAILGVAALAMTYIISDYTTRLERLPQAVLINSSANPYAK